MTSTQDGYEFTKGSQPKPVLDIRQPYKHAVGAPTFEMAQVLDEIVRERAHQDEKWGGPEDDDTKGVRDWVSYIVVYLGRAVGRESRWGEDLSFSRIALVKVAALCVAALESFDRKIANQGL